MKIPIPWVLVRVGAWFVDWVNEPVSNRYDIRRLDLIMGVSIISLMSYYGYRYGWIGALQSGVLFIVFSMLALFMRRG